MNPGDEWNAPTRFGELNLAAPWRIPRSRTLTSRVFMHGEKHGDSVIRTRLRSLARPKRAKVYQRFFKTGPGEYGEGDRFLGLTVPQLRKIATEFAATPLGELAGLLRSPIHEERLVALFILVRHFARGAAAERAAIFRFYFRHVRGVNNWDLVDASAPYIVGPFLAGRSRAPLYRLTRSGNLWERRIAILATQHFIRSGQFGDTLRIAAILLRDEHELIHKAVGWMLREVGKRDLATEERFLRRHHRLMPRTMLRYAIERFPERKRLAYLHGRVR